MYSRYLILWLQYIRNIRTIACLSMSLFTLGADCPRFRSGASTTSGLGAGSGKCCSEHEWATIQDRPKWTLMLGLIFHWKAHKSPSWMLLALSFRQVAHIRELIMETPRGARNRQVKVAFRFSDLKRWPDGDSTECGPCPRTSPRLPARPSNVVRFRNA